MSNQVVLEVVKLL